VKKNRGESGFALLLVFAMAATIALLFYIQMPRVAFERQRDQEALLISRGEQYKRAIQLYFRKFKTYPTSLDSLENTNNLRFLRRRYIDPLTGKDEWRLIHIGPGGIFTDSITNKPKDQQKPQNQNNFITEGPSLAGGDASASDQSQGPAFRRRPSEGGGQPQPTDPNVTPPPPPAAGVQPGTDQQPQGTDPNYPQGQGTQAALGQNPAQPMNPAIPGQNPQPGSQPNPVSAFPGIPGAPVSPGSQLPGAAPTDPNAAGLASAGGFDPSQGSSQAADLIRGLLTRPRSMPTNQPTGGFGMGGTQISAGSIAGVASKVERRSIKVYNDHEKYNEWEFIYDFSKDRTGMGQMGGLMGQPGQGQPGQVQPVQQPSGIPGFGGAFGTAPPTQGQQPTMPGIGSSTPPTSGTPQQ